MSNPPRPQNYGYAQAHRKALEDLNALAGREFDAAFARQMIKDHQEAVALFTQAAALQDKELSGFASRTLPTLKQHQDQADQLRSAH